MKILYISVHAILEYDEISLLTELGHDVFSLGAYTRPEGHFSLPRPAIAGMRTREDLIEMSLNMPRTEMTWQFVDNFDAIIVMDGYSGPEILSRNWHLFKNKKTIWRTIGQSLPEVEGRMRKLKKDGMKILRYSPMEEKLHDYAGADALIRFYKDPNEFCNWNGDTDQVINFSQSLKARRDFCGYNTMMLCAPGNPLKVYGEGNEDLGEWNGGRLTYDAMKGAMRDCRVYLYTGTWPASYTLSFIEALMTGIPMVCAGTDLWRLKGRMDIDLYEVPKIVERGEEGFWSSNIDELKKYIAELRDDKVLAHRIGQKGREKAIKLFGKQKIKEEWATFLANL